MLGRFFQKKNNNINQKQPIKVKPPNIITLQEKIFIGIRPEKVYFAALNPLTRVIWDKNLNRARFAKSGKNDPMPTKVAPEVLVNVNFPVRLGGVFQMRFADVRAPLGFSWVAVRGSFGLLGGLGEVWQFQTFKGGTQVMLTRQIVPRIRFFHSYVEQNHIKAMKQTLENLKRYVEAN